MNAVIPSITAYAPGPEDPEVQKYHAKKRLELKPGDKVPDSEDETRKIVKEKFKNDSKKWIESIPRNVKLPELPKEPDWNSIGWDKLKGTDPETTILRRWILSKFIDYKKSKYYNPKALSPETLKQIELLETKELDRIAHELYAQVSIKDEKYDPFNWNTIGSLVLMCGGGLVIKPAGAGVITLETAIGIMAGGLGEGLFAGIVHKASSKAAGKASESVPAKSEPIRPMTEAELEKVSGGAKNPGWNPGWKPGAENLYSNLDDGLNFSAKALEHMREYERQVPIQTLQDAIRYGKAMPDPRGSSSTMYYTTMNKNGKMYNLEVLYDKTTNTVYHFEYARKTMGNLPTIPK